jgi:hypothetical protein
MTLTEYREQLIQHCGGKPNPVQALLIDRAIMLSAHLQRMDRSLMTEGGLPSARYVSLSNALTRTARALGVDGPAESAEQVSLADLLAG